MRKTFLINKPFQLSILGWFLLFAVLLTATYYSAVWYFFFNFKKEAVLAGIPPGHVFYTFLNEQKMAIDKIFLISSCIAAVLLIVGGILLSHKVAGPLHQLTEHLKNHDKENVTPVHFRKGDYFSEIQDAFNNFIKK